jgi:hypothetical protein
MRYNADRTMIATTAPSPKPLAWSAIQLPNFCFERPKWRSMRQPANEKGKPISVRTSPRIAK